MNKFFTPTSIRVSERLNDFLNENFGYVVQGDIDELRKAKVQLEEMLKTGNNYVETTMMLEAVKAMLKSRVDEISAELASKYKGAAIKDKSDAEKKVTDKAKVKRYGSKDESDAATKDIDGLNKKIEKRKKGIASADKRIEEASTSKLMRYGIAAARDNSDKRVAGQKMADEKMRKADGKSSTAKIAATRKVEEAALTQSEMDKFNRGQDRKAGRININKPTHKFFQNGNPMPIGVGQLRSYYIYLNRLENGKVVEKKRGVSSIADALTGYGTEVPADEDHKVHSMKRAWEFMFGYDVPSPDYCEAYFGQGAGDNVQKGDIWAESTTQVSEVEMPRSLSNSDRTQKNSDTYKVAVDGRIVSTHGNCYADAETAALKLRSAGRKSARVVTETETNMKTRNPSMQENLLAQLNALLEGDAASAEIVMAARGIADDLQDVIEKLGKIQNDQLGPLTDQMMYAYGAEKTSQFKSSVDSSIGELLDSARSAKDSVADAVLVLSGEKQPEDTMMDGAEEIGGDMSDDFEDDIESDDFADAEPPKMTPPSPLGRSRR